MTTVALAQKFHADRFVPFLAVLRDTSNSHLPEMSGVMTGSDRLSARWSRSFRIVVMTTHHKAGFFIRCNGFRWIA